MRRRRPYQPAALPETMVADESALAECVDHLLATPVIGFDTEFVGEDVYRPDLCLVQISTAERLFVIDPFACGPLDSFWAVMHDPARTVIVHAGREEVRMCRFLSGRPPANLFDVQIAAGLVGLTYPIGYAGLVQAVLGARVSKGDTLTDWRRRPLSASQVRYAYDDVRYLIPAWERIDARLAKLNRTGWAAEEFGGFITWATGEGVVVERWRKLKGLGALNRRELAVARAVGGWRDEVAERQNRPLRAVMRDDVLIEVARRGARSADEVTAVRGIPRGEAEAVRSAVRTANALPLSACPEVIEGDRDLPQVAVLGPLLAVVLNDVCERSKLAASLVCSLQDLKDLVRARQPGATLASDSPFRSGWRKRHVLPYLAEVLDGKTAVRVDDPRAGAPLEYVELDDDSDEEDEDGEV